MATETVESRDQFTDTPTGEASRWNVEMTAAEQNQKTWWDRGEKVVKRFLDNRSDMKWRGDTRVNLFTANVQTLRALLYGKTPQVDVKRRFADPNDDVARVAGEILQRLLNTDIERDSDTFATALENALDDRLLPGLGVVRLRYEAEFEDQPEVPAILDDTGAELAPAYTPEKQKVYECVDTDYVYWRNFRWSPARTWDEVRWVGFQAEMTKDAMKKRFGDIANRVPLAKKSVPLDNEDGAKNDPWARAEVWEIWSKEDKKVYWWVKGFPEILDVKDDPLELDGFWPLPRPMFANATTTKLIPTPDFTIAQDIYDEIDEVSSRITLLEKAVAVRGVYDKTSDEVKRLLTEAKENEMIPMEGFALFKEKGGLKGVIDWLPLEQIVGALDTLRGYRTELMALLFQVTGMSDIMRGQASGGQTTATEQAIKARFASVRVQEFQQEFARFASDAQALKAEIISKHFSPETIVKNSNIQYMMNASPENVQAAVQLIKSDLWQYRIEVKPESVAMADMAAVKQERSEFLMAIATFLQSSAPITQAAPWMGPYLLQMLQWAMAGFRGGATIEGVLDQAVTSAQQQLQMQQMQPPPPDPQMEIAKVKMASEQQKAKMDIMGKMVDLKTHVAKNQADLQKAGMEHQMSMQKMQAEMRKEAMEAALGDDKKESES